MLLNAFDLETSSGTRNLELRAGAYAGLEIEADLLAVSSEGLADAAQPDAFISRLQRSYGLNLQATQRAVDLSGSLVDSWVSAELTLHPVPGLRSTACSLFWPSCRCRESTAAPWLPHCSDSTPAALTQPPITPIC